MICGFYTIGVTDPFENLVKAQKVLLKVHKHGIYQQCQEVRVFWEPATAPPGKSPRVWLMKAFLRKISFLLWKQMLSGKKKMSLWLTVIRLNWSLPEFSLFITLTTSFYLIVENQQDRLGNVTADGQLWQNINFILSKVISFSVS